MKIKNFKSQALGLTLNAIVLLAPCVTFAATSQKLSDIIGTIAGYLNSILALLMGFAVVMFVYFIIKYFIQPVETDRKESAAYLMWSVIGFFVILSMWGIVNILLNTFNVGNNAPGSWTNLTNLFPR